MIDNNSSLIESRCNRLKHTRHGLMLYNINDRFVGRSLDIYGEFSEAEIELFNQTVRPGATVVDAGANIGAHTLFFARTVGETGLVLAFEPQRVVFQMLCANMALNDIRNVHCFQMALGSKAGQANIPVPDYEAEGNFGGFSLNQEPGNGEEVRVMTLDAIDFPRLDFVKIDVEGLEAEVIRGSVQNITRHKPLLYVENDRRERSPELIGLIRSLGYDLYWHLPPLFNPNNFFGQEDNVFGHLRSGNVLGVPQSLKADISGLRKIESPQDWPLKE